MRSSTGAADATTIAVVASTEEVLRHPEASERLLTETELKRAAAFRRESDRLDYVAGHVLVRLCAAHRLGLPARALTLVQQCPGCGQTDHGRPALAERPELRVSLSHTNGVVGAVAGPGEVGIDVELLRRQEVEPELLQRVLTPAEVAAVEAEADQHAAFLRQWVRKEALVKIGRASLDSMIDTDLSALPVTPAGEQPRHCRHEDLHLLDWADPRRAVMIGVVSTGPAALGVAEVPLADLG